jgi:hypothetical protein
MTVFFPVGITQVAEGSVTMKRLQVSYSNNKTFKA